jgi:hypothetical protein
MKYNKTQLHRFRHWKALGKTAVEIMDITGIKMAVILRIEKDEAELAVLNAKIARMAL